MYRQGRGRGMQVLGKEGEWTLCLKIVVNHTPLALCLAGLAV